MVCDDARLLLTTNYFRFLVFTHLSLYLLQHHCIVACSLWKEDIVCKNRNIADQLQVISTSVPAPSPQPHPLSLDNNMLSCTNYYTHWWVQYRHCTRTSCMLSFITTYRRCFLKSCFRITTTRRGIPAPAERLTGGPSNIAPGKSLLLCGSMHITCSMHTTRNCSKQWVVD